MMIRNTIQQWAWRHAVALRARVHDLTYFFWEATLRCNLGCQHCGSDCTRNAQTLDLPTERVLTVFRNIAEHYDPTKIVVAVTGGEALLRPDLFSIMEAVHGMGFRWGMVTNGMQMDERAVAACARSGMRTISVSLDGLEASHNWLRGHPQSFRRAARALQLLVQAGQFGGVEAITCVHSGNVGELEQIYQLLREWGVHGWRIFTIFPQGRAAQHPELTLTRELLEQTLAFIADKRKTVPDWPISYSEEGYLGCDRELTVRDIRHYCGAGVHIGSLLADGSYSACPSLGREWIQGHVDELPFSEAWETRYRNMRAREWMRNPTCGACRQWANCQASSLHLWDWEARKPRVCHYRLLGEGE
jgi:radical SAM protein with 4Fe4S-binding SPASM domain